LGRKRKENPKKRDAEEMRVVDKKGAKKRRDEM